MHLGRLLWWNSTLEQLLEIRAEKCDPLDCEIARHIPTH